VFDCWLRSRCAQWFVRGLKHGTTEEDGEYQGRVHLAANASKPGLTGRLLSDTLAHPVAHPLLALALISVTTSSIFTKLFVRIVKLSAANSPQVGLYFIFSFCRHHSSLQSLMQHLIRMRRRALYRLQYVSWN